MTVQSPPPLRLRLFFWVVLGMFSTALAEVVSGSMPFVFFNGWGVIVTNPLYSLHILVLAAVLVRLRRLSWPGLCFAGALFGLYEAYITKVLWNPPFAPGVAMAGEVAWLHVVLLVLWWHPVFAFVLPLLVGETVMTRSRTVLQALPGQWSERLDSRTRLYAVLFAVACGLFITVGASSPLRALLSPLANGLLLMALVALWRRTRGPLYSLEELLPGNRALAGLVVALGLVYAVLGVFLLPERLPGLSGHLSILGLYALFGAMLWRTPQSCSPEDISFIPAQSQHPWLLFLGILAVAAVTAFMVKAVLGPSAVILALLNWAVACIAGPIAYGMATFRVLRRDAAPAPNSAPAI